MAYPSLEQYNNAFNNHSLWLADPELKAGTVGTTGMGLPLAISGGFALTYTITAGSKKYAVRCFHRESKALERRYTAISRRLASLNSPYFLDFQFQRKGIRVEGGEYPIVKMAWAKGETLGEFIEDNHNSPQALGSLASSLESLSVFLEKERIAHGDIQTGNLMVSGGGSRVQLIDYDGMWLDEIKDLGSAEVGHINFQHPGRKDANPFDSTLDRFSLISLWLSIEALRTDPSIWGKTNSEIDAIVFRASDFIDPSSSQGFALLASKAALAPKAKAFAAICASPMQKAPTLADFIAGRNMPSPPASVVLTGKVVEGKPRPGYIGAYEVLSATEYEACLPHVGNKVEVIGKIVEVKNDVARNRKPYIFVNFGPWRGRIFKIAIWSDGLDALRTKPDDSWVGKWVSVVGLMEPPFESKKYRYSHLSINVTAAGQMTLLSEADARWRLAGPRAAVVRDIALNQDILGKVQDSSRSNDARQGTWPTPPPSSRPTPPSRSIPPLPVRVSPNQSVLNAIRASSAPPPPPRSVQQPAQPSSRPKGMISSTGGRSIGTAPRPPQRGLLQRLFGWLFR
ncbi:TPA: serine/threonine protein kinase [Burkholderia cenocepacia]|uniref:serine/threonine protein kinase n=1 Tax=Burkholderia cenocepacia TaxID=95486 RepID=UPI001B9E07F6|nr:serine/threonine protein kinase [Burkholderia cenocepacia]MBR8200201.1 serine/threonine protein kinase [Burkholderia cenocepacia]HDV6330181.1 serine/threonine protein kinase [Burkholderia cenocepacia]HDV6356003.1 serine/threonine protein kinase [Burkholderia cenocepacia]